MTRTRKEVLVPVSGLPVQVNYHPAIFDGKGSVQECYGGGLVAVAGLCVGGGLNGMHCVGQGKLDGWVDCVDVFYETV